MSELTMTANSERVVRLEYIVRTDTLNGLARRSDEALSGGFCPRIWSKDAVNALRDVQKAMDE